MSWEMLTNCVNYFVTICKSGPFVSAEGCKYQSVHLYPEIKVLMIELNVFYEKFLFLTVYCNIPN